MESTALSVFPLNEQRRIMPLANDKKEFSTISGLNVEDRQTIETIAKRIQAMHKESIFSSKTLPSRVLLKFFNIERVGLSSLRNINISTHRIRKISINLKSKYLFIELKREVKQSKKHPVIRKRRQSNINPEVMKKTISIFLKDNAGMVRDEDERLIRAVLECIIRWTWDTVAAEVTCSLVGDNYNFRVKRIQSIDLSQLESLCDLGDYVQNLTVDLNQKMVQFKVLRTSSYIHDSQVKRRKL